MSQAKQNLERREITTASVATVAAVSAAEEDQQSESFLFKVVDSASSEVVSKALSAALDVAGEGACTAAKVGAEIALNALGSALDGIG